MNTKHKCIVAVLAILLVVIITGCASGPPTTTPQQVQSLSFGTAVSANLDKGTDHWYSIQSPITGTVAVYTTGNTDTYLRIYDSNNSLIARNDDGGEGLNASLSLRIEAGITYIINVRGALRASRGHYQIMATSREIEQAEAAYTRQLAELETGWRQARDLSLGTAVSANLDRGNVHWYSAQSPIATTMTVYTTGNTDTFLRVYDSNNRLIAENDDGGEGSNARLEITAGAGSTYLFRVSGYSTSTTGSYQIIATTHATQMEQARALSLGTSLSVNLGRGTEQFYSVQSPITTTVIVYTTGSTDTYLSAYDSNGLLIAEDNDSGQGSNARLEIPVEGDRTYFFRVRGFQNTTSGSYQIIATTEEIQQRVEEERRREAAAGFIDLWSAITGTVLINGAASEFTAEANNTVRLRVEEAADKEFFIAVRDSGNRVHQALETVRFYQWTGPNYRQYTTVLDPNPPPTPEEEFGFIQNVDGGITINSYRGTRRQIVIPNTIHGINVTAVGAGVFRSENGGIFSVVIPNTVTQIGYEAFAGNQLSSITLPASLRTIGYRAFSGNRISSITIPNNVTVIGEEAFYNNGITTVVIPASLSRRTVDNRSNITEGIGNRAFTNHPEMWGVTITRVTLPANMDENAMRANFETALANFYISQNRAAGTYVKNGPIWSRQ